MDMKRPERFLTVNELADLWKVEPNTIRNWMVQGKTPPCTYINGAVRFAISDVEDFEKAGKQRSGNSCGT